MITPQQQQQISQSLKGLTPTPTTGGTSGSDWYLQIKSGAYRPAGITPPTPPQGFGDILKQNAPIVSNEIDNIKSGVERFKQAPDLSSKIISGGETLASIPMTAIGGVLNATGIPWLANKAHDIIGTPIEKGLASLSTSVIPDSVKQSVKNFLISPGLTNVANKLEKTDPQAWEDLNNAIGYFAMGLGSGKASEVAGDIKSGASKISQPIDSALQPIKSAIKSGTEVVGGVIESGKSKMTDMYKNQELSGWTEPATINKPGFSKSSDIFTNASSKGHNISETLVKNGIKLSDNLESGKYNTADSAEILRTDAMKLSREGLRPSLQMADYSTPKTPVSEIINSTIKDIQSSKYSTPGDIKSQIAKLKSEGEALQEKYPEGMSLTDMHDNRITYNKNAGYKIGDSPDTGNIKSMNRSLGNTLADTVVNKAPKDLPVSEFQNELSKHFQAADYLDSINGKTAPRSTLQKIAQTTAKVVGAKVGASVGGIMGGVGGYHLGGLLESMVEGMSDPVKSSFLDNLSKTNPKAFKAVSDYIGTEETARFTRKALPAPSELETEKNPIITPSPTTFESKPEKINMETSLLKKGDNVKAISMPGDYKIVGDTNKAMIDIKNTKTGQIITVGKKFIYK